MGALPRQNAHLPSNQGTRSFIDERNLHSSYHCFRLRSDDLSFVFRGGMLTHERQPLRTKGRAKGMAKHRMVMRAVANVWTDACSDAIAMSGIGGDSASELLFNGMFSDCNFRMHGGCRVWKGIRTGR
jgi:hypothetical protein